MAGGGIKQINNTISGGADGATYIPSVSENGVLSWTVTKGGYNVPPPITVKGKDGKDGAEGPTGAKLVRQVLQGQDENGGNIYLQTFDDGTVATFIAPRGQSDVVLDTELDLLSSNAVENRVITNTVGDIFRTIDATRSSLEEGIEESKYEAIDQSRLYMDASIRNVRDEINEVSAIAMGAVEGKDFPDYQSMVNALNEAPSDFLRVPNHILIQTVNVPDLWVMEIKAEKNTYTYVSDEEIVNQLADNG